MANQLVLYANRAQDSFRWCWLDAELRPVLDSAASGELETLATTLGEGHHSAWLIVPGNKAVTCELEYQEQEKKHLRRLLPYQLEEAVIGDIDQFHFALGPAREGRAVTAYIERAWMQQLFDRLGEHNIEITRAHPLPLMLPLPREEALSEQYPHWTLQLEGDSLLVHHAPNLGFSVERFQGELSLQMLLTAQQRVDNLPHLQLRAASDAELLALESMLPKELQDRVDDQALVEFWQMDFSADVVNLCQGEFSQRLPIERWWKDWQTVVAGAAACLVIYIGVMVYQVQGLEQENVEIRRQVEQVYRSVVPQGNITDPERQLSQQVRDLQPAGGSGRVTPLLADLFPALAESQDVSLSAISYASRAGELSLNVRANAFNSIESLRTRIQERGLEAELLSASAQGDSHSARIRVTQGTP